MISTPEESQPSTTGINKNPFAFDFRLCVSLYSSLPPSCGIESIHLKIQRVYEKYPFTPFCTILFDSLSKVSLFFVVIDFCLEKCLICDPETNFQSLRPQWASKANCTQRKGMQTALVFYHGYVLL